MGILEVKNLSFRVDEKLILNNLNIDFWDGHVHAVVGPNGAGKSTLAATIMGLSGYRNFEGDIVFKGESIRGMSVDQRAKKEITLAWQEPARFEGITIREFIRASAKDKGEKNLRQILDQVGLEPKDYLTRAVDKTLSGGERKKVELASIMAMEPELALLDEPDSGIDIESIEKIFESVKLLRSKGTTVIMITHSLAVLNKAEHAFLMCNGTIVDKGTVDRIRRYFEDKCIPCPHKNIPEAAEAGGAA